MANTKITTSVITADAITGALIADDVALGGSPTTSTQSSSDNSTKIATTAYVTTAIDNLVDSAPGTMNTLNEIAAALNDDANFNTTVTNLIAAKAAISGQTFTGDVQAPGLYVGSTNTSYDFYNNGTSYLNGNVTIDADLTISSAGPSIYLVDSDNNPDYQIKNGNGSFRIIDTTNSADRIKIHSGGKVDIGGTGGLYGLLTVTQASGADNDEGGIGIVDSSNGRSMRLYCSSTKSFINSGNGGGQLLVLNEGAGQVSIGNDDAQSMHSNANKLVVGTGSGDQGMSIFAGTSVGRYAFARAVGNNTDAYDGGMSYDGNRNLTFHTNAGSERLRINGSGNIGFGTTTLPSGMSSSSYKQFKIGGAVLADSGHSSGHNVYLGNNVYSGSGNDLKFTHSSAAALIQMTGGKIYFRTHDGGGASADATATINQRVQIHNNGRVAIGDHSPESILDIKGGGYNSIIIGSNRTDNTNKLSGISAYMYTNNQVSLFQNFNQNGSNALYYGSADGSFRGLQSHYFMVNSNYNATSGHKTAMYIDSGGGIYMGSRTSSSFNNDGVYVSSHNGSFIYLERSPGTSNSILYLHRRNGDGSLIDFYESNSREGYIQVSGSTVSLVGFGGAHDSSGTGISSSIPVGTVLSTIDEEHKPNHAKVKVSDSVGDKRVYGVLQEYKEEEENDTGTVPAHALVAAVGIGSVRVTGACEGGDLLESNGDGTAKVQDDDIIRSKTIGKVTIGDSETNVKLVSCVLYCG